MGEGVAGIRSARAQGGCFGSGMDAAGGACRGAERGISGPWTVLPSAEKHRAVFGTVGTFLKRRLPARRRESCAECISGDFSAAGHFKAEQRAPAPRCAAAAAGVFLPDMF